MTRFAGHDDEGGVQAVDGGDGELEVGGLLREIGIDGEHAQLRVAELNKKERLGGVHRGLSGGSERNQQECDEPDEGIHDDCRLVTVDDAAAAQNFDAGDGAMIRWASTGLPRPPAKPAR